MTDRIQITKPTFMEMNGQWSIVLPGSVVDVPAATKYSADNSILLTETAGPLINNKPTGVRSVKLR